MVRLDPSGDVLEQHVCPDDMPVTMHRIELNDAGDIRVAGRVDTDFKYCPFVAAY